MNWLAEYFAKKTATINVSLWAWPPLGIGPDGPVAARVCCLPYPGVELAFAAETTVERQGVPWTLPASWRSTQPLVTLGVGAEGRVTTEPFFRSVAIYAPSLLNDDFVVCVNDTFTFVPRFASDGSPAFSGTCLARQASALASAPEPLALPWTFHGYLTI